MGSLGMDGRSSLDSLKDWHWDLHGPGIDARGGSESQSFVVENPPLWWPSGMGEPTMVGALLTLTDPMGQIQWSDSLHFGIRRVEWVQEADSGDGPLGLG